MILGFLICIVLAVIGTLGCIGTLVFPWRKRKNNK